MTAATRPLALLLGAVLAAHVGATELRDPTRPPMAPVAVKRPVAHGLLPRVSAVLISSVRRVAIFDDQPVQEGDVVGAYRIETILATGVRYRHAGLVAFAPLAGETTPPPSPQGTGS
jgi:hypothetical protein